jgi:hypothetical protein
MKSILIETGARTSYLPKKDQILTWKNWQLVEIFNFFDPSLVGHRELKCGTQLAI